MKKVIIHEGDVFLVPMTNGGYARGLIARYGKKSGFVFGFFFSPKYPRIEEAVPAIKKSQRIYSIRFYHTPLVNGEWPLIGRIPNWERAKWPTPDGMIEETLIGKGMGWRIRYSDDDPQIELSRKLTKYSSKAMSGGSVSGAAIVYNLDQLLH